MIQINVYPDGDKMCAIIGDVCETPETICVGYGDTAREAIISMLDEMEQYHTFCPICLQESDERMEYETKTDYSCPDGHEWSVE